VTAMAKAGPLAAGGAEPAAQARQPSAGGSSGLPSTDRRCRAATAAPKANYGVALTEVKFKSAVRCNDVRAAAKEVRMRRGQRVAFSSTRPETIAVMAFAG
jgi:hypothetical protein